MPSHTTPAPPPPTPHAHWLTEGFFEIWLLLTRLDRHTTALPTGNEEPDHAPTEPLAHLHRLLAAHLEECHRLRDDALIMRLRQLLLLSITEVTTRHSPNRLLGRILLHEYRRLDPPSSHTPLPQGV